MLVDQNTKEKVAQSRRENQKKYLKELLARYETVATKIEVMAVIVKLKKLGFLARIRILENELNIREKKKKNKDFRKRIKYTREKEEKILSALVVILVYENFS